ncbi:MAG: HIT family protein [Promethearchaeota archaeon]
MSDTQASCIFCKIIAGEVPSHTVYSDDKVIAFLDIRPINPGHTLVVPKAHVASLGELSSPVDGHLFQIARLIAAALFKSGLRCEGINLLLSDGKAAFQEIPHIHLHVIPRFQGDSIRLQAGPDYGKTPPANELIENADKIRSALKES